MIILVDYIVSAHSLHHHPFFVMELIRSNYTNNPRVKFQKQTTLATLQLEDGVGSVSASFAHSAVPGGWR